MNGFPDSPVRASAQEQDYQQEYIRARMVEPDWAGGVEPLQREIIRLRAEARGRQQAEQALEKALVEHEADLFRIKELQSSIDGCAKRVQQLAARLQQAEQARDEEHGKRVVAEESFRMMTENAKSLQTSLGKLKSDYEQRVAALTQALKDYGQHKSGCRYQSGFKIRCVCGLDAALTGANDAKT